MIKKIALAVVLSTTALSAVAEESKDFYAQVNAGYAFGMKSKTTVSNTYFERDNSAKVKTGKTFSIGLEAGAQINEYLRAGLSFDYMPDFKVNMSPLSKSVDATDKNKDLKISDAKTFNGKANYSANKNPSVKSMNIMANLFIDAGNFSGFKPYAVVGLGLARNKGSSYNYDTTPEDKATLRDTNIKDANKQLVNYTGKEVSSSTFSGKTKNNFAFKAGLGFKYAINEDFDVDVRYQYLDLGKAEWKNAAGKKSTVRITANQLMLGVAYKF